MSLIVQLHGYNDVVIVKNEIEFNEFCLHSAGTKRSSYENRQFQQRLEKYHVFIRSLEQVHDAMLIFLESLELMSNAGVGLAESL